MNELRERIEKLTRYVPDYEARVGWIESLMVVDEDEDSDYIKLSDVLDSLHSVEGEKIPKPVVGYWATCEGCGSAVAGMSASHLTGIEVSENIAEWASDGYLVHCSRDQDWSVTMGTCSCPTTKQEGEG